MEICQAGKLAGKGGESSETGRKRVGLPIWMQGLIPTQKVREESGSHTTGGRDRALLDLTKT